MNDIAIKVDGLGKLYRLGERQGRYKTLRETITDFFAAPYRKMRNPKSGIRNPESEVIWALEDVSFEIKRGEVVGIIGRNGAGKSTLLKVLSRIAEPTKGYAEIYGRVGSLLEVGTGFHPELTGRENIYLNGAILGMKRLEIDRKFDEIVAFAEIEKFIDTPVKHYSSGMYLRLAFAVAAHLETEILLVDEVLAVGDVQFQKKCLGKMSEVAKHGRTVLFVSHNMAAVRKLCSRALLLEQGKVETTGTMDAIVGRYLEKGVSEISSIICLPDGNGESAIKGVRLRFFGQDGTPKALFSIFEKWQIVLDFELTKSIKHVIAGVGLMTVDGIPITQYWSEPQDLMPGNFKVTFPIDITFASQGLQLNVGISSNERPLIYSEGVGRVEISDVAVGQQPVRSRGTGLLINQQRPVIQPAGKL